MNYRYYCVQFPLEIQAELRLRYRKWYEQSLFLDQLESSSFPGTLILPADFLIHSDEKHKAHRIIAFGSSELLESSFLAGAHDYLKDPWNCRELVIRSSLISGAVSISIAHHTICSDNSSLIIDDKSVALSEFQNLIFYHLMTHSNILLPYSEIGKELGMSSSNYKKSLHVHINRIRTILKSGLPDIYGTQLSIENIRSLGYRLNITCE